MIAFRDLSSRTIEITIIGLAALEPDPTFARTTRADSSRRTC
jgi:hypothetical protein